MLCHLKVDDKIFDVNSLLHTVQYFDEIIDAIFSVCQIFAMDGPTALAFAQALGPEKAKLHRTK
jgi:hypothetical protein